MRFKPALLLLLAVVIAATVVLAVSLRNGLSLGIANAFIESRASEFLNRKITLAGAPRLQLKSGLHIALGDVALAGADWGGEDPMLTLDSLEAELDLRSLFSDQIIVNQLDISGLTLHLHRDSDGRSNIPTPDQGEKSKVPEAPTPGPLPVLVKHLTFHDVQVVQNNEQTAKTVELLVDVLAQDSKPAGLSVRGQGSLQGHPWQIAVDTSNLMSLRTGLNMSGDFSGSLGELQLQGDYQLPDLSKLENLSLNAALSGPMPPRIAELSPIFEAHASTDISLEIRDVTPGLEVSLHAELPHLRARVSGTIDDPAAGDGIALDVKVDSDSLPRLARHFELDLVDEVPVNLKGRLLRQGDRVEFRDGVVEAGDNQVKANLLLPAFPGTNGASVQLSAAGSDFSLYQTLLDREPSLKEAYNFTVSIDDNPGSGERVSGILSVGKHDLTLSGVLDNFPSYAGSQLNVKFSSPQFEELAAAAGLAVPDTDIDLSSDVTVADDAVISIRSTSIAAYNTTIQISGRLNGYPDFDDADISLRADADSLAELGDYFGLKPLGDVPVRLTANLTGRPDSLALGSPSLSAGEFKLQGVDGALRFQKQTLSSDLRLSGTLTDARVLLGAYAPDYLPTGSYTFDLSPTLSEELFSLALDDLSGPGVSGSARLELSRDFTLDENTLLESTLRLEDLAVLLPPVEGYQPAPHVLTLNATTRPAKDTTKINVQVLDGNSPKLNVNVVVPAERARDGITMTVTGAGDDITRLGRLGFLPREQLSYKIDVDVKALGKTLAVDAREFSLGASSLSGNGLWDYGGKALQAQLQIPNADLQAWIPAQEPGDEAVSSGRGDGRRIPDLELPLDWLHDYHIDLTLETGNLGLTDPRFTNKPLIEMASLRLKSGDGVGLLNINKLQGSRGELTGMLKIDDSGESAALMSELSIAGLPLGVVAADSLYAALPRYDLNSSFTGVGNDIRSIAATLNGDFLMVGGPGTLQKIKLSAATESFIAQVFETLLPMLAKGSADMEVECAVLTARANDGILSLDPGFVFRSKKIDLSAHGQINLGNEELRIDFNNRARKGLGLSAASIVNPFVAVSGTLARPRLGLDITNSAISGGAAVATAGATIIAKPVFERLFKRGDPCEAALKIYNASPQ